MFISGDDVTGAPPPFNGHANVVACICNPATLEAAFQNGAGSVPVGGNSPSIGGWIVWPPVIQRK